MPLTNSLAYHDTQIFLQRNVKHSSLQEALAKVPQNISIGSEHPLKIFNRKI
jgi:hypothetical protein